MSDLMDWPDYALPAEPLNDSYAQKLPDRLSRTDFEQGVARQRRRFRSGTSTYQVTWPLTAQQKFIFDGFLENGLHGGEDWFNIPVFTNADYQQLAARFVKDSISISRDGGEWMVEAQLEVKDYPWPSDVDTAAALLTYGTDMTLSDIVALFDHIVHVDIPGAPS